MFECMFDCYQSIPTHRQRQETFDVVISASSCRFSAYETSRIAFRKTGRSLNLPAGRRRVGIWEDVVAQSDSRDCAGKVTGARRGIEADLTSALLQDHHYLR